ncbi:MAG: GTP-binding protein [Ruminococcus sp.]|nr:GTP-binding protein [Ruminococcus sp.]
MKKITLSILAHVDSGKTTLSEAILYKTGVIRKWGRVDHRDTFFDTHFLERERGITIFSKQGGFTIDDTAYTLLDTPGHSDFSNETERTLQVTDYAILVISGSEKVQSHTETLWDLLKRYNIPVFIFVNKTDLPNVSRDNVMYTLKKRLSDGCVDFGNPDRQAFFEELSLCDESLMEEYLEKEALSDDTIKRCIADGKVFPCCFGSALKMDGVDRLLELIGSYAVMPQYNDSFGAKIYKISEDEHGNRVTHMKITGGQLKVKTPLKYTVDNTLYEEKINQIRIYSGNKYSVADEADVGTICAVTGLSAAFCGQGIGCEENSFQPILEPVLSYGIILPPEISSHTALTKLRTLEAEDPQLHVMWDESSEQIQIKLMGKIQLEILSEIIKERFGFEVEFTSGSIAYRETVTDISEGVGHYEPLKHYSEVHLLIEPAERGSGLVFETDCREEILDKNWQRLILTHLKEKTHIGVLTGSPITDIKITLKSGKAHLKHTEGGDFRQSTYRAVRQGLRRNKSILLEPFYKFRLEIPTENTGRALTDFQQMCADFNPPEVFGEMTVIHGQAPVSEMCDYHSEVISYTKGRGRLSCTVGGYCECHNSDEVIENIGYNCDSDTANTADSVFCSHGAGFVVKWDEVENYMHLPSCIKEEKAFEETEITPVQIRRYKDILASDKELMEIFERTYGKIKRDERKAFEPVRKKENVKYKASPVPKGPEYLLVDGYNIIFAWDELKKLAQDNLDTARNRLIDKLCNYQGFRQCELILVFDAYKVKGGKRNVEKVHNINVVYTKEAETADMYIEKVTHEIGRQHRVRVATSDNLEQVIILGNGAFRVSAAEFEREVNSVENAIREIIDIV